MVNGYNSMSIFENFEELLIEGFFSKEKKMSLNNYIQEYLKKPIQEIETKLKKELYEAKKKYTTKRSFDGYALGAKFKSLAKKMDVAMN